MRGQVIEFNAVLVDPACTHRHQTHDCLERRRLAGTVAAKQA
jgi:hypothetical protein